MNGWDVIAFWGMRFETHMIFELLSYTVGFRYYLWNKQRYPDATILNNDQKINLLIAGIFGAALGSKILGILEHPDIWAMIAHNPIYVMSAKTIVGGLLGGLIGVELAKKIMRIRVSTGDAMCFPLMVGIIIGRMGCFLAGVKDGTWGNPTQCWIAMDGGDGILRHPTPLYDMVFLVCLWMVIAFSFKKKNYVNGRMFQCFMVGYLGWRLVIDTIKPSVFFLGLPFSAIQLACIAGLIYYWLLWRTKQQQH
jgi:phosphatidylglycerol:prolipoprotein diacylglycerol transferase